MPKGKEGKETKETKQPKKPKRPKVYLREERLRGTPNSMAKINDFLKEKNRDMVDYIKDTIETAMDIMEVDDMEIEMEDEYQEYVPDSGILEDSDCDETEETVREAEEEEVEN